MKMTKCKIKRNTQIKREKGRDRDRKKKDNLWNRAIENKKPIKKFKCLHINGVSNNTV